MNNVPVPLLDYSASGIVAIGTLYFLNEFYWCCLCGDQYISNHSIGNHKRRSLPSSISYSNSPISSRGRVSRLLQALTVLIVFALFFIASRIGTLRQMLSFSTQQYEYNHRETDEQVFQVLVKQVQADWTDYSLGGKPALLELNLAPENYDHAIFIHPPFFVYSLAALNYLFSIPLPVLILIFQLLSLCIIPPICHLALSFPRWIEATTLSMDSSHPSELKSLQRTIIQPCFVQIMDSSTVSGNAVLLVMMCPFTAFCSQKIWIDNGLVLTVLFAIFVHLSACRAELPMPFTEDQVAAAATEHERNIANAIIHTPDKSGSRILRRRSKSIKNSNPLDGTFKEAKPEQRVLKESFSTPTRSLYWHALSGLVFGGIALNCKVTAGAALPFLLFWTLWQRYTSFQLEAYRVHLVSRCLIDASEERQPSTFTPTTKSGNIEGGNGTYMNHTLVCDVLLHYLAFTLGMMVGHGPWIYLHKARTGKFLPNAWPSATMLRSSSFVRNAVNKPWYTYVNMLLRFTPGHFCGLFFALLCCIYCLRHAMKSNSMITNFNHALYRWNLYQVDPQSTERKQKPFSYCPQYLFDMASLVPFVALILSIWPITFILSLTGLGALGAGFQSRFMLPALPGLAILASIGFEWMTQMTKSEYTSRNPDADVARNDFKISPYFIYTMAIVYAAMNTFYYMAMFAPLFAELEHSVIDIVRTVLQHPFHQPMSRHSFEETLRFMLHYGLNRSPR